MHYSYAEINRFMSFWQYFLERKFIVFSAAKSLNYQTFGKLMQQINSKKKSFEKSLEVIPRTSIKKGYITPTKK